MMRVSQAAPFVFEWFINIVTKKVMENIQKKETEKTKKKVITAEMFKAATGSDPVDDDLERCNCDQAGEVFHMGCGWCEIHNLPIFMDQECFAKRRFPV